ncbi:MAG: hypothetical protein QM765_18000 [Myxococcales bacterium]
MEWCRAALVISLVLVAGRSSAQSAAAVDESVSLRWGDERCPNEAQVKNALAAVGVQVVEREGHAVATIVSRDEGRFIEVTDGERLITRAIGSEGACDVQAGMLAAIIERFVHPLPAPRFAPPEVEAPPRRRRPASRAPAPPVEPFSSEPPLPQGLPEPEQAPVAEAPPVVEAEVLPEAPPEVSPVQEGAALDRPWRLGLAAVGFVGLDQGRFRGGAALEVQRSLTPRWDLGLEVRWPYRLLEHVGTGGVRVDELRLGLCAAAKPVLDWPLRFSFGVAAQGVRARSYGLARTEEVYRVNPALFLGASAQLRFGALGVEAGVRATYAILAQELPGRSEQGLRARPLRALAHALADVELLKRALNALAASATNR